MGTAALDNDNDNESDIENKNNKNGFSAGGKFTEDMFRLIEIPAPTGVAAASSSNNKSNNTLLWPCLYLQNGQANFHKLDRQHNDANPLFGPNFCDRRQALATAMKDILLQLRARQPFRTEYAQEPAVLLLGPESDMTRYKRLYYIHPLIKLYPFQERFMCFLTQLSLMKHADQLAFEPIAELYVKRVDGTGNQEHEQELNLVENKESSANTAKDIDVDTVVVQKASVAVSPVDEMAKSTKTSSFIIDKTYPPSHLPVSKLKLDEKDADDAWKIPVSPHSSYEGTMHYDETVVTKENESPVSHAKQHETTHPRISETAQPKVEENYSFLKNVTQSGNYHNNESEYANAENENGSGSMTEDSIQLATCCKEEPDIAPLDEGNGTEKMIAIAVQSGSHQDESDDILSEEACERDDAAEEKASNKNQSFQSKEAHQVKVEDDFPIEGRENRKSSNRRTIHVIEETKTSTSRAVSPISDSCSPDSVSDQGTMVSFGPQTTVGHPTTASRVFMQTPAKYRYHQERMPKHAQFGQIKCFLEQAGYDFSPGLYCLPGKHPGSGGIWGKDYFESEDDFRKHLCAFGVRNCPRWDEKIRTKIHQWVRLAVITCFDLGKRIPDDYDESYFSDRDAISKLMKIGFKHITGDLAHYYCYPGVHPRENGIRGENMFADDKAMMKHLARFGLPKGSSQTCLRAEQYLNLEMKITTWLSLNETFYYDAEVVPATNLANVQQNLGSFGSNKRARSDTTTNPHHDFGTSEIQTSTRLRKRTRRTNPQNV